MYQQRRKESLKEKAVAHTGHSDTLFLYIYIIFTIQIFLKKRLKHFDLVGWNVASIEILFAGLKLCRQPSFFLCMLFFVLYLHCTRLEFGVLLQLMVIFSIDSSADYYSENTSLLIDFQTIEEVKNIDDL